MPAIVLVMGKKEGCNKMNKKVHFVTAPSWRIAGGYQNAGTRPSLKLSLMYFLTSSDWKILTNFW